MIDSKMIGFHNHVLAPKCWKTYCLNPPYPPAAPESSLRNTRYTGLNLTGPDGVIVFRGRLPAGNITDIATAHGNFRPEKAPCVTAMSSLRMTPTLNPFLNPVPPGLLPSVFTSTRLLPSSAPCLLLLSRSVPCFLPFCCSVPAAVGAATTALVGPLPNLAVNLGLNTGAADIPLCVSTGCHNREHGTL